MPQINNKKLSSKSSLKSGNYLTSRKHFFNSSKLFYAQITDIFDYLWPTVTALKNLRWQVNGFYHISKATDNLTLTQKFVDPDDVTNRPNLFRICIDEEWVDQERQLAKSLLVNLIACYETWCEMILQELQVNINNAKKLQFPTVCPSYIASICSAPSITLTNCYYDVYKDANNDAHFTHIDNYLTVFRYFKECRNTLLHSKGVVTNNILSFYNNMVSIPLADLDILEMPEVFGGNVGDPLQYSLRGVVGFAQILMKIVAVLDCELVKSIKAESYYVRTIKAAMTQRRYGRAEIGRKKRTATSISRRHFFADPRIPEDLYVFLQTKGIIGQ